MKTPEILHFLGEAIPVYESLDERSIVVPLVNAFLGSLPQEQLVEVDHVLQQTDDLPYSLSHHLNWLIHRQPKAAPEINEPITDLIRWYNDKKSKKVEYARVRLIRRFDGQSYAHQYAILKSFLAGDQKACDWAARRLWDNWIPEFEDAVALRWETTPSEELAMIVIRHLSIDYVMRHREALCQYADYKYLCCRLYGTEGFTIDENRLGVPDLFFVMGRLGRNDQIPHLRICLAEYFETHQTIDTNTLYWMGRLGMTEDLIELYHRFTNN